MRGFLAMGLSLLAACSASSPGGSTSAGSSASSSASSGSGSTSSGSGSGSSGGSASSSGSSSGGSGSTTSSSGGTTGACPADAGRDDPARYTELTVQGDLGSTMGIFDPSMIYPADGGVGLMTYSSVPDQAHIFTRIAGSTDHGASWTYLADVNQPETATVTTSDPGVCGAATCSGTVVHEVSSITVDLSDPDPARRFKVFTHSYLIADTPSGPKIVYQFGYISMFTSAFAQPADPWTETKILGWNSSSPFSTTGVGQNVNTDPTLSALSACVALSEPGVLPVARAGVIDLALTCVRPAGAGQAAIDVELLRSVDHGASWSWVSTPVTASDAAAFGAHGPLGAQASAPDLFERGGAVHLFFTPNGDVGAGNGYRGCLEVAFDDLDAGTIERCGGLPVLHGSFLGQDGVFTGACTFAEGDTADGVVVPVAQVSPSLSFHVDASHQ